MKALLFLTVSVLAATEAFAIRGLRPGIEAFDAVLPRDSRESCVFSPVSFELDAVLLAETMATIPKAQVAEILCPYSSFADSYPPVLEALSATTNRLFFKAARAFFLGRGGSRVSPQLIARLQREYDAGVFGYPGLRSRAMFSKPEVGVSSWLRAKMQSEWPNLTVISPGPDQYSFFDYVSIRPRWVSPLVERRNLVFHAEGGERTLDFLQCTATATVHTVENVEVLRLPIVDGGLYFLLPAPGMTLGELRLHLPSERIVDLIHDMEMGVECRRELRTVTFPRLDCVSAVPLVPAMAHFGFKVVDMAAFGGSIGLAELVQHVRFQLPPASEVASTPSTDEQILDRPFLFFVYFGTVSQFGSEMLPVIGQFTGPVRQTAP